MVCILKIANVKFVSFSRNRESCVFSDNCDQKEEREREREHYGYMLKSKELMDGAFCQEELINWCYFLLNPSAKS